MRGFDGGGSPDGGADAAAAVEAAFRAHHRAIVNRLAAHFRDRQLAEDAVQEAFESAARNWHADGIPDRPDAWLVVTARRKAIDRLRRGDVEHDRLRTLADAARDRESSFWGADGGSPIADDHLRLLFTCCHPALSIESRVALTLRIVCGMSSSDIAAAMLTSETAMAQRLSRAKRKIRDAHIPYRAPSGDEIAPRLAGVLATVYLIFNSGYTGRSEGVCAEAIQLGRLLTDLVPGESEPHALLALMCFHAARMGARVSDGRLVPPEEQQRMRWDRELLEAGWSELRRMRPGPTPGPYQLQALIAAAHADAAGRGVTDWAVIASLYGRLAEVQPSPVVELNRAVAVGMAGRPEEGLAIIAPLLDDPRLTSYQPLHAAHAELLRRTGSPRAADAYLIALQLTSDDLERDELVRRLSELPSSG